VIQIRDVRAVVIFSDEPARLAAWYRKVFALRELVSSPDFIGLAGEGVSLFIQRTSEGHKPGVGGIRPHFTVASCRTAYQQLCEAGARTLLPPTSTGDELVAAVQDPDGNPIGLLSV
jgi:predicted enzyme related to lactoylglutathione lyase